MAFFLLNLSNASGKTIEYNLEKAKKHINITGKSFNAMAINGSTPGPVLRFQDRIRTLLSNKSIAVESIVGHREP